MNTFKNFLKEIVSDDIETIKLKPKSKREKGKKCKLHKRLDCSECQKN